MLCFSTLVFGSDHAGFSLKQALMEKAQETQGIQVVDQGVLTDSISVDYPDIIPNVVGRVNDQTAGVLVCGSGVGMSIGANRYQHIRAVLCHEPYTAALSRRHNQANVIVFGSRILGVDLAFECLQAFLRTPFDGGRHVPRIQKLSKIGENL